MRYSRHKRSGISYGCHKESHRTTFSCHKRSCFAISYPLSRIHCRCRMYRRFGVGVSADNSSLLPPPNGSSMAMQVNARTHSEPFMAANLSLSTSPSQTFYMLMKSFHLPSMVFPHLPPSPLHTPGSMHHAPQLQIIIYWYCKLHASLYIIIIIYPSIWYCIFTLKCIDIAIFH